MPTVVPGQDEHYASPNRRQSLQAQTSLADQLKKTGPHSPTANRSAVYLPTTTYSPQQSQYLPSRTRTPSHSTNFARTGTPRAFSPPPLPNHDTNPPSSVNPDDFYRDYTQNSQLGLLSSATLHQEALRTLNSQEEAKSRVGSNGSYSTNWSLDDSRDTAPQPKLLSIRSRKSSVKNLVAQINASSTAEVPPVPIQPVSTTYTPQEPTSYLSSANVSHFGGVKKQSHSSRQSSGTRIARSKPEEPQISQRRPLFGELLPTSVSSPSAGFGIVSPRTRAGSDNSPMHSPNPMFPPDYRDSPFVLSPAVYAPTSQGQDHRRSQSDALHNSSYTNTMTSPISARRPPITSRIPVGTRRLSAASDSETSAPSSRAPSALDKRQVTNGALKSTNKVTGSNQSLSVQDQPGKITSPGRRVSPPLRSSRPRLPVSSASTAASRARMAEKFNSLQKINNEKRAAQQRRVKPPELTDIDLDARRSRITQALTKSRESEELTSKTGFSKRWESQSRISSPRPGSSISDDVGPVLQAVPGAGSYEKEQERLEHQYDQKYATRNALHVVGNPQRQIEEDDSPTLGHDASPTDHPGMQIQTNLLRIPDRAEPQSAVTDATAGTEATHIDPEPQEDADAASLLSHVMQMRDTSPSGQFHHSPRTYDEPEDRADVESVNLVLRNTTYLDDDEAIKKGYRTNFSIPEPLPEEPEDRGSTRDSWTSSLHDEADNNDGYFASNASHSREEYPDYKHMNDGSNHGVDQDEMDSYRDTMASDAYTTINVVLQEHSSSGIVDQQFVDDVYQKVLETCPEMEEEKNYDSAKIEQLCLQEILRRHESAALELQLAPEVTSPAGEQTPQLEPEEHIAETYEREPEVSELPANDDSLLTLPSTKFQGHRQKPSLDSAEDWAGTSPSIGDWARFAVDNETPSPQDVVRESGLPLQQTEQPHVEKVSENHSEQCHRSAQSNSIRGTSQSIEVFDEDTSEPEEYGVAIIRAPSRSPPPPPKDNIPSIGQISRIAAETTPNTDIPQPRVPHRITSLNQVESARSSQSTSRPPSAKSRTDIIPWESRDLPADGTSADIMSPEARRLKKRKHIIKELVDTENIYQRDMRVLCDIYKQTAAAALTEDDIRVLFGNVEQVQIFARDFLTALKQTSKASYVSDRKKDPKGSFEAMARANSSSSTLASAKIDAEITDLQRDRETRIGDAFEGSLKDMEVVYAEYIRNRHAANQRLEALQKSTTAQDWLKECRDNSSDITNAWNLDALLVKPVQRITKYPLLLRELIDATVDDHPDLSTLKRVLTNMTDINIRINDVKKHAEMLDQAINRKRGQSDVRTGFSKAFGRRAEKLRQHVGITEMYEDTEYDKLRIAYDNNYVQLMVVANDCLSYDKGITQWVNKMVEVAAAAEAWVDVGHSHHQQEESKLRHFAMIVRNVHNIALPDHLEHLQKKVIKPMTTTVDILQKFKDDPKGLLHKRDKRLVDYAQMKNRKDKGEKVDKKMSERMDQWEALNTEAKERMRKLLRATAHLVQSCQGHLVQLQMSWMVMIQQKLSNVMGINLNRLSLADIEKTWQEDFDFQEASALTLGVCNGSLILQAANMTSFLTPSSTLNGEDSPRQMSFSSLNNNTKRSISINSDTSTVPTLDFGSRPSGTYTQNLSESHFDRPYPYPSNRNRAASTTSGKSFHRPEVPSRASTNAKHTSASANFARLGTSPSIPQDAFAPPRLSVETLSPLMSSFPASIHAERPLSSNTFFSASPAPSQNQPTERSRGSGVFSSALPMSDSPVSERHPAEALLGEPKVLFTAASVYEFNIDRARREAGFPYLTYVTGEIFDVVGERGELWLAKNQDDPNKQIGWIWNKHFARLAE
ncbi:hypothetical protein LTS08_006900 [Lithohypha guttulata]|nr:hypothetical protein LTS08_006900 [Lithohypha guttulata]